MLQNFPFRSEAKLRILDACFGLGYNTFCLIEELRKLPDCPTLEILGIESQPEVLTFLPELKQIFPNFETILNDLYEKNEHQSEALSIKLKIEPLENLYLVPLSKEFQEPFHLITHDAFTSTKCPELWSLELFQYYFNHLVPSGRLATYAFAKPVSAALIESGFSLSMTKPIGRKSAGLLASKETTQLVDPTLAEWYDKTTAKVPYRALPPSENLKSWRESIFQRRDLEKKALVDQGYLSIGQYLKYKKRTGQLITFH